MDEYIDGEKIGQIDNRSIDISIGSNSNHICMYILMCMYPIRNVRNVI